jgi:hypothetical protein
MADGTVLSVEDRLLGELMEPTRLNAEPMEAAVDGWTSRPSAGPARKK